MANVVNSPSANELIGYIRDGREDDIPLAEIMALAEVMVGSVQTFFTNLDASLYNEFREIAEHIQNAKSEIAKLQTDAHADQPGPAKGREFDTIVEGAETATNAIMEAAERIVAADPADDGYGQEVDDAVMAIFKACASQDTTAQRISKLIDTVNGIDDRVNRFIDAVGAAQAEALPGGKTSARSKPLRIERAT